MTQTGARNGVAIKVSTSSLSAVAWSSIGKKPRSAPVAFRSSSSVTPARPHLVCCMSTTALTPSLWLDRAKLVVAARRLGFVLRITNVPAGLADLIDFVGLRGPLRVEVVREAEGGEEGGIDEVVVADNPLA